jgi:hypothetical protein
MISVSVTSHSIKSPKGKIMKTTFTPENYSSKSKTTPIVGNFHYKTIVIYPKFADVGMSMALLKKEGFTDDQISLLGREQEHWRESIEHEWDALKTTKGVLVGAALGSIPGLVVITGVALTGGVGLLAAGPLIGAVSALGLGALGGAVVGGGAAALGPGELGGAIVEMDMGEEIKEAISHGYWVVVVHSHDIAEAVHARGLLTGSRTVHDEHESK